MKLKRMSLRRRQIDDLIIDASLLIFRNSIKKNKKRNTSIWVTPYLQERREKGRFSTDFEDMVADKKFFKENFHMTSNQFDSLYELIKYDLAPKRATRPDAIPEKEKFAIALEYFASGTIQRHLAASYRISKQHIGPIIDNVSTALCRRLKNEIDNGNMENENLLKISNDFNYKWNLPNCVGAIDGKHIALKCPKNAGSRFFNYKGFHSIVLMAIADANYKFIYIDIGAHGSEGDANIFGTTSIGRKIMDDTFSFPEDAHVGGVKLPFYFVGDDAFPLTKRIIKPYAPKQKSKLNDDERIFNYRLSRARRVVENAFGVLTSKWLCLSRTMNCHPDRAQKIASACCYLHNWMLNNNKSSYCPPSYVDSFDQAGNLIEGNWRKNVKSTPRRTFFASGRHSNIGKQIRDHLRDYVISDVGRLPWQNKAVFLN